MNAARVRAGSFSIPPDHPCLPGHMPGAPIVPGALLLDRAIDLIAALDLASMPRGPIGVKFPGAVAPGDEVDLHCDMSRAGMIVFEGRVGARLVLSGWIGAAS